MHLPPFAVLPPTRRRWIALGVAALATPFLAWGLWHGIAGRVSEPAEPAAAPLPVPEPIAEPVPVTIEEHEPYYDVVASYPDSTPLAVTAGVPADREAVARMRGFIEETIADFKRQGDFGNLTPEDIALQGLSADRKQSLAISYESYEGIGTVSYAYTLVVDTLGAHPNAFYRTFTFDRGTGAELSLAGLFLPRSGHLERLSAYARFELGRTLGEFAEVDYLELGTAPTAENFANFVVTDGFLEVLFPPYQVAPYAAGTQSVAVPLEELDDILKPAYRTESN